MVTYANEIKTRLAGVPPAMLLPPGPGAVSEETARAMATGGLERLGCTHCLSVTGIAGPEGAVPARHGRPGKPVGTVFIARATDAGGRVSVEVRHFRMAGDRGAVREWSARSALAMLWQHLAGVGPVRLLRQVD
jgi:PncC family amidohydrolase